MNLLQATMKLLVPAGVLLTSAVLRIAAELVVSTGVRWQSANVRESLLSTTVVKTFPTTSQLRCASIATLSPWCSLYCYIDGVCQLLNYTFPASGVRDTNCKTSEPAPGKFQIWKYSALYVDNICSISMTESHRYLLSL